MLQVERASVPSHTIRLGREIQIFEKVNVDFNRKLILGHSPR